MTESDLNLLRDRVTKREDYIKAALRDNVPVNPLEELFQTNEEAAERD